jgi:hypothetical protein
LKADIFVGSILVTLTDYRRLNGAALAPVAGGRSPAVADADRGGERRPLLRRRVKRFGRR